jgi:RNA polymerase sigma factor (sigma-70 family)
MSYYDLSNLDIKMTYIVNEKNDTKDWMHDVFVQTKFFAESRAKKYKNRSSQEDLFQEAYVGLWEAILTYDYQKNFDFFRWAQWNISKKLRNYNSNSKRFSIAKSGIKNELGSCNFDNVLNEKEVELEMKIIFEKMLIDENNILSNRERSIVVDNLVLGKKLGEIASKFNLSTERIRQIRNCSLNKLKAALS